MIYKKKIQAEIHVLLRANKKLTEEEIHVATLTLETRLNSGCLVEPIVMGSAHIQGNARFHFKEIVDDSW